jgi:leucyl aminopeptidase
MNNSFKSNLPVNQAEGDCLLLAVYADNTLSAAAEVANKASNGAIKAFLEYGDFTGKADETLMLYDVAGLQCKRTLLVGCGDKAEFDVFKLGDAVKAAMGKLSNNSINVIVSYLGDEFADQADAVVMQSTLSAADARYQFTVHKSENNEAAPQQSLVIAFTAAVADASATLVQAEGIAAGSGFARDLSNQPGNICHPTYLAEAAKDLETQFDNLSVEILEEADMEALGMGSLLSVSQGSDQPAKLIVLKYNGAADDQAPVALVGKGVTFDTGGISLKPGLNMDEMKFDMGGAASVFGSVKACAEMKLAINVIGVIGAVENMPSARATRPGDIVKSMSGTTIEVLNTDAEGRLVLCDALTYVGKYKPKLVIDIATLTGACIVALGRDICALIANDQELADGILKSGKTIGDHVWQLPLHASYKKLLKSAHADLGNIGGPTAGTITAACFLSHFAKDYRWAHLDIAGTAWTGKDATGRPVPLLTQFLIDQV